MTGLFKTDRARFSREVAWLASQDYERTGLTVHFVVSHPMLTRGSTHAHPMLEVVFSMLEVGFISAFPRIGLSRDAGSESFSGSIKPTKNGFPS